MKYNRIKILSFLLTLAMVVGLMPGMSLTAYAYDGNPYESLKGTTTTVTFNGKPWYIIEDNSTAVDAGTVTLLAADTSFGTQMFDENGSNKYSTSQVKAYLDSMTGTNGAFADVADAIETVNLTTNQYRSTAEYETVNGVKLYLLSTEEANSIPANVLRAEFTEGTCTEYHEWWLRSPGGDDNDTACVYGDNGSVNDSGHGVMEEFGVRPALKLNLESVIFSSELKTFTVGLAPVDVTGVTLDKTTVQTIDLDGKVSFTATVAPDNATDKKVVWSVSGDAVKLYSDQACTAEVGADATETLTVYAKGESAGSATITCTSNADNTKTASCDVTVNAAESSTYTITIPDTLTVQNIGWNELEGGITASGDLESGAKLVITASSDNNFNFVKSGDNTQTVSYDFCASSTDLTPITTWEFTSLSSDVATIKTAGINIADYSNMPAGTYKETVTFTAKVEILVTSLELTDNSMFFYGKAWPGVSGGFTLNIRVLPENATNKRLNWSIDGDNCISLSVSDDTLTCHVTGQEPGEANIIVSTTDGSNLSQTFSVEVEEPMEE